MRNQWEPWHAKLQSKSTPAMDALKRDYPEFSAAVDLVLRERLDHLESAFPEHTAYLAKLWEFGLVVRTVCALLFIAIVAFGWGSRFDYVKQSDRSFHMINRWSGTIVFVQNDIYVDVTEYKRAARK